MWTFDGTHQPMSGSNEDGERGERGQVVRQGEGTEVLGTSKAVDYAGSRLVAEF